MLSSYVNITIPQVDTPHIEPHLDWGEQPQSSAVESSTELVLSGSLSRNDLVDI